ncbi:hypothetical protein N9N67_12350 [Bacteriovoracaceae bacterium]|nr:hypothetical protein [Bacteriovoracaceae bacterium]
MSIFKLTLFTFLITSSASQASILFCNFDNIGRVGIRDIDSDNKRILMQESWIGGDVPYTEFNLLKIHKRQINNENIKIKYSASAIDGIEKLYVDLDLELGTKPHYTCYRNYRIIRPCIKTMVPAYVGKIKVKSKGLDFSYSGKVVCDWQYRNL